MLYAKSNPKESIEEHTNELLKRLDVLIENYGKEILNGKNIEEKNFWNLLTLACTYHDIGKVYTPFQNMILEKMNEQLLETSFSNDIKHEQLSPLFLPDEEIMKLTEEDEKILTQTIFYHHERDNVILDKQLIEKIIKEDIIPRINSIEVELQIKINKNPTNYYLGYVGKEKRIREGNTSYIKYVLLKGLLHRLDHSASAHVNIEDVTSQRINNNIEEVMQEKNFTKNELQIYCQENSENNMVIVGSTGMGKTEAGLLWSGSSKIFFTLPIRISINAIYDRIREEYKYKYVGLLHSSALDYLESKNNEGYEYNYLQNEEAINLSNKITTCTIDQIFTFVFKYAGYEKVYATLAYSKIIIDEIQAYSPEIVAVILKGLEMIHNIGGKFLIMTATLPRIYKDKLIEMNIPFKTNQFLSKKIRHKIEIKTTEMVNDVQEIIKKSNNNKILIIVNTIEKAIEMYHKVKENGGNACTLHSRFIAIDREEKEKEIKEFAKSDKKGIWITTQIVEASIDIDFDYLYTEMSTLDSLFQRLGRCYRRREWKREDCNVYIYTNNISGIGSVYDKEIYAKSLELLKDYNRQVLSEEDKVKMVDSLYSKESLKDTEFLKKFEDGMRVLDNIVDYDTSKKDAQKILRNIENIKVIPKSIFDENKDLFEKLKSEKNYNKKRLIRRRIENLSINISKRQAIRLQDKLFDIGIENIKGIDMKYSKEEGLLLTEKIDDNIESRMF